MTTPNVRLFFSVGDHSGDIHGANLIEELQQLHPQIHCEGFGGEQMANVGCQIHYPLCDLAIIGIRKAISHLSQFVRLRKQADKIFDANKPDALVLIDYPGFNWWMARSAKKRNIPVYYFIPPQMWAWAGWRAKKMRRLVDHTICCLPFEAEWYQQRNISSNFVGHPYFDELRDQQLDSTFLAEQRAQSGSIIGLLPGSRNQELEKNVPTLLQTMKHIHAHHCNTRFLIACFKPEQRIYVQSMLKQMNIDPEKIPVQVCVGKTPEIIELAHSCVTVSGSVSLELLFRTTPTVIIYRGTRLQSLGVKLLMTAQYITLVNMLANRELFPEHYGTKLDATAIGNQVLHWLENPLEHARCREELVALKEEVAQPGACQRAAQTILERLTTHQQSIAA